MSNQPGYIRYLSPDDIAHLNAALIATQTPKEQSGVKDLALLESSQQSPSVYKHYNQTVDMAELAAVLAASLAQNHPFFNANKRTATMAALTFLILNGWECTGPEDELIDLIMGIVLKSTDRNRLVDWYRAWCRPFDASTLNKC